MNLVGLAFHIGSGIESFEQLVLPRRYKSVYKDLSKFFDLKIIDIGGGLSHKKSLGEDLIEVVINQAVKQAPNNAEIVVEPGNQ